MVAVHHASPLSDLDAAVARVCDAASFAGLKVKPVLWASWDSVMRPRRPLLSLLRLPREVTIKEQLWLEEALLRHDKRNWCVMKDGEPPGTLPTIVLGIGGKVDQLVDVRASRKDGIPLVRRFSGGGTVVVDTDTLFVTFIMNTAEVTPGEPYPRPIMQWTAKVYAPVFSRVARASVGELFELRENDYVFGSRKFGGNAQSIVKDRWLHHTSLLWDYQESAMGYLTLPDRRPEYRRDRDHSAFLTRLKDVVEGGRPAFYTELERALDALFETQVEDPATAWSIVERQLGGIDSWKEKARTKEIILPPER